MRKLLPLFAFVLSACGAKSYHLESPVVGVEPVEVTADRLQTDLRSQIDILFVIDNSLSMKNHQENLSKNIKHFVEEIDKNALTDFHFGIVTVHDSMKFGKTVHNFNPLGVLLPPKNPLNPSEALTQSPRFITRDTKIPGLEPEPETPETPTKKPKDYLRVLETSLLVGVADGPEFEESFTPVLATITDPMASGPNQGFFRPDAHLVVIFLTDANDSSPNLSPQEFRHELIRLKGGNADKVMAFGALAVPYASVEEQTQSDGTKKRVTVMKPCKEDPSGPPARIQEFLRDTSTSSLGVPTEMSLCAPDFGARLARIGSMLREKVGRKIIPLPSRPDYEDALKTKDVSKAILVTYGTQIIPPDYDKGWSYDVRRNAIIISGKTELKDEPGAKLTITFIPVRFENMPSGKVKRYKSQPSSKPAN